MIVRKATLTLKTLHEKIHSLEVVSHYRGDIGPTLNRRLGARGSYLPL